MSRYQRCQTKVIVEKCTDNGQNAAEMLVALHEQVFQSMSVAMKSLAPQMIIPKDCASRNFEESSPSETNLAEQSEEAENDEDDE
jgi:hypothetical protein